MSLPNEPRSRKRLSRKDSGYVEPPGVPSLTADEFNVAADTLIGNGLHPIAIGKANPNKPDKPAGKAPWHSGVTGYKGGDANADQVMTWALNVAGRIERGERGVLNIGMRMPVGGIGLDVDAYDGKRGLSTVAEHEARLGALPPTYRVTARPYAEGSGIRLFRVPDDWHGATILKTEDGGRERRQHRRPPRTSARGARRTPWPNSRWRTPRSGWCSTGRRRYATQRSTKLSTALRCCAPTDLPRPRSCHRRNRFIHLGTRMPACASLRAYGLSTSRSLWATGTSRPRSPSTRT